MSRLTFVQWHKHGVPGDRLLKREAIGAGLVRAFSATLAVFLLMGVVVAITNQPVYHFSLGVLFVVLASALIGGGSAGAVARIRGWQHGGVTGFIYGAIFAMISAGLGLPVFDPVILTVAMALLGSLGGIIGVNLPAVRRRSRGRREIYRFIDMER
ncbi:TIGR04086 family membrane protein [Desulforamulus ruminis]|uniref:TIGR04086 family membrane protein n=1 Tax=Desulforamulus ruminis (strain ATCC 23193 / DSM 2154 / NCIMB 8452 / DL) TaxID=696281 RepID=F6DL66_DESRL|nr:TIGR04086 family membrane protein [Desulforamulus ruminis]AEG59287.1 hypothetical protein Desru_1012 [Desulforamulus ruminis DSM 2154]